MQTGMNADICTMSSTNTNVNTRRIPNRNKIPMQVSGLKSIPLQSLVPITNTVLCIGIVIMNIHININAIHKKKKQEFQ